jgi:predicted porin
MRATQTEISERLKQYKLGGTLTTSAWFIYTGTAETIRSVSLKVPVRENTDVNANIEYSLDKGVTWTKLYRGNSISVEVRPDEDVLDIKTSVNNTVYEGFLLLEDTAGE